ncbi:MAG: hypothetical protein EAZ53_03585 [Bacteroidetes bacterium]|nr:MAG: hypothetical protein EAZ53_03585 [Bacteroidota bacterium]
MQPIKIHKHASDPYWQMLKDGAEMTVKERYESFFLMQKRLRAIIGKPLQKNRSIIIKSIDGFGG